MNPTPDATATYEAYVREVQSMMFQQGINSIDSMLIPVFAAFVLILIGIMLIGGLIYFGRKKPS